MPFGTIHPNVIRSLFVASVLLLFFETRSYYVGLMGLELAM